MNGLCMLRVRICPGALIERNHIVDLLISKFLHASRYLSSQVDTHFLHDFHGKRMQSSRRRTRRRTCTYRFKVFGINSGKQCLCNRAVQAISLT